MSWSAAGVPGISVKGPMHELICSQTCLSSCWGSTLKSVRDIQVGAKLTSFKVRAAVVYVRATYSGERSAGSHNCSFVEPSHYLAGRSKEVPHLIPPLTWLNTFTPPRWFPETSLHPIRLPSTTLFQQLFHTNNLSWLMLQIS